MKNLHSSRNSTGCTGCFVLGVFVMHEWDNASWQAMRQIIEQSDYDYRDDFRVWLKHNPQVWAEFVRKVKKAWLHSHKSRFSARAIMEVIRWETMVHEKDVTFKINNNYVADLSRLVMEVKPELKGYFQIRGSSIRRDAA